MLTRSGDGAPVARGNLTALACAAAVALVVTAATALLLGLHPAIGLALSSAMIAAGVVVLRRWNGPLRAEEPIPARRWAGSLVAGVVAVLIVIQAVPYGWSRSNPPVSAEPAWDSPRTRELTVAACFDCHSNEVDYPWYARVAPISWAVQRHVSAGRHAVNFSEWDRPQEEADESAETVREGSMPPAYYSLVANAEARLSEAERRELEAGLVATIGRGHDD